MEGQSANNVGFEHLHGINWLVLGYIYEQMSVLENLMGCLND